MTTGEPEVVLYVYMQTEPIKWQYTNHPTRYLRRYKTDKCCMMVSCLGTYYKQSNVCMQHVVTYFTTWPTLMTTTMKCQQKL